MASLASLRGLSLVGNVNVINNTFQNSFVRKASSRTVPNASDAYKPPQLLVFNTSPMKPKKAKKEHEKVCLFDFIIVLNPNQRDYLGTQRNLVNN